MHGSLHFPQRTGAVQIPWPNLWHFLWFSTVLQACVPIYKRFLTATASISSLLSSWEWPSLSGCRESHGLHLQSLPLLNRHLPFPCLLSLRWGRRWRPRSGRLLPGPWSWVPRLSGVGWRACETSILQLHTLIDLSVVFLLLDGWVCRPPPPHSYHIPCATDLHTQ